MPGFGVRAASELGARTDRLALVPDPGARLADVVAALLDGMGLVRDRRPALPAGNADVTLARRLTARARGRNAVLIVHSEPRFAAHGPWPAPDLIVHVGALRWSAGRAGREAGYRIGGPGDQARSTGGWSSFTADDWSDLPVRFPARECTRPGSGQRRAEIHQGEVKNGPVQIFHRTAWCRRPGPSPRPGGTLSHPRCAHTRTRSGGTCTGARPGAGGGLAERR